MDIKGWWIIVRERTSIACIPDVFLEKRDAEHFVSLCTQCNIAISRLSDTVKLSDRVTFPSKAPKMRSLFNSYNVHQRAKICKVPGIVPPGANGVFKPSRKPQSTHLAATSKYNKSEVKTMEIKIQKLLYSIGLTANYTGYRQMMIALEIASQEPESLCSVTKWLYPETARRCGTNWKAVERNIRTALRCAWKNSQYTLERMAGCSFDTMPKPAQFLAILAHGLSNGY